MKRAFFILLAILLYVLPGQAQQWAGLPSNSVPAVAQEQTEWCWAASSQLILNFSGLTATQSQIVFRIHNNLNNLPGSDADVTNALNAWGQMPSGQKLIVHAYELPGMLTAEVLYQNLKAYRPVLVAIQSGPSTGHAVVITAASFVQTPNGLVVTSLAYRDPSPSPENIATSGRVELDGAAIAQFVSSVRGSWVSWVTIQ